MLNVTLMTELHKYIRLIKLYIFYIDDIPMWYGYYDNYCCIFKISNNDKEICHAFGKGNSKSLCY